MTRHELPFVELGCWPTPLVRARRLEARLRSGPLLIKRDDLSGFAVAGNKARPLEYLLGDAVAHGYDTVVVGGVSTSNFCAAAAVAARAVGLGCDMVLPGRPPPPPAANLAIALACGVQVSFSGGPREQLDERIRDRAAELNRTGRSAMPIPRGGATAVGSRGFVRAAHELAEQLADQGHDTARVVLAVGSGASIAGLVVGASQLAAGWAITGVSVSRPLATLNPQLHRLIAGCAELLGVATPDPALSTLTQTPNGLHGSADTSSAAERAAALLALETEGLMLDSDYTSRAFPTALQQLKQDGPPVVFWHTGGLASALSGYATTGADLRFTSETGTEIVGHRP